MRHGIRPTRKIGLQPTVLQFLSALSDTEYGRLLDEIRHADDLLLPKDTMARLEAESGATGEQLRQILSFADSVVEQLGAEEDFESEKKDFLDFFRPLSESELEDKTKVDLVISRLEGLLKPWAGAQVRRKKKWLERGILPTGTDFASFVDLRPDFSSDRKKIGRLVPIVLIEIVTDSQIEGQKSFHFQLSKNKVAELRELIDDIESKLTLAEGLSPEVSNG